ncbi:hypothetical protein AMATHDRAFT_58101 [Amanita thiersii Skay4041]|uniref:Dystroglycan-type cadherin-like domain-containing protein n=1 Tax=Amanita thiersii Skay4041 TaxID=703135 RepID=A0A2A9NVX3_9AGAR|nr:hypothetical protein AMATHDRAFT_58101 [Amanita thiersii Skay4041]
MTISIYLRFFFTSLLSLLVACRLSLVDPPQDQLPLIARTDKPFSWSFSAYSFQSIDGTLSYTASALPGWLAFNPLTRTLHGTPSTEDEGNPSIIITAHDGSSSVSSSLTLCVTPYPSPVLNLPISAQFYKANPSLSSVFTLASRSSIATDNPALRIPPGWSFSIGFQAGTYIASNDLYYYLRQSDGRSIPHWMTFNRESLTIDGVAPVQDTVTSLFVLSLNLVASDQAGYSAQSLPFDLIIAPHELSLSEAPLPAINLTMSSRFNFCLLSPVYLSTILVDGNPIDPSYVQDLVADVTQFHDWLHYDPEEWALFGESPKDCVSCSLPVKLITTFNQTIEAIYPIKIFPSLFLASDLGPLSAESGVPLEYDLSPYITDGTMKESIDITTTFEPTEARQWLAYDCASSRLEGTIPSDSLVTRIAVSFLAYSQVTHSMSRASLDIHVFPKVDISVAHHHVLSAATRARLSLALGIVFGTVGGFCLLGAALAIVRHCTRIEDSAITGEEGRKAWSAKDKQWYGIISPSTSVAKSNSGHGWTERAPTHSTVKIHRQTSKPHYGHLGLGLRPMMNNQSYTSENVRSGSYSNARFMKKGEFLSRIKETVRNVSDRCKQTRNDPRTYPVIGKPILVHSTKSDELPLEDKLPASQHGSTFHLDSPSSSTTNLSAPLRRADFGFLDTSSHANFQSQSLICQTPTNSPIPGILEGEVRQRYEGPVPRPKLVPFTSVNRVPIPQDRSNTTANDHTFLTAKRAASQKAKIWRLAPRRGVQAEPMMQSENGDELSVGLHYVRTLGDDQLVPETISSVPTVGTTNILSSFSSLESSHQEHCNQGMRVIVRTGEGFKFRLPVSALGGTGTRAGMYEVRLTSGGPLPHFIRHDLDVKHGCIELHGTPARRDLGSIELGVYEGSGSHCIAQAMIDVIGRN